VSIFHDSLLTREDRSAGFPALSFQKLKKLAVGRNETDAGDHARLLKKALDAPARFFVPIFPGGDEEID
jgi:hypothetical protein